MTGKSTVVTSAELDEMERRAKDEISEDQSEHVLRLVAEVRRLRATLTPAEMAAIEAVTQAWRAIVALPRCHPTELAEAVPHVHHLQGMVMQRLAVRAHPDQFAHVEGFE